MILLGGGRRGRKGGGVDFSKKHKKRGAKKGGRASTLRAQDFMLLLGKVGGLGSSSFLKF